MLSPADMLVVGVAALLFFGPDQLPKVARRAGQVVRDVQATSASFIHEMERAADEPDHRPSYVAPEPYAPDAPTVTLEREPPATAGYAAPVSPGMPAPFDRTHPPLGDVHAPLDQSPEPSAQAHITVPPTGIGPTDVNPLQSTRNDPKPPEPTAPI